MEENAILTQEEFNEAIDAYANAVFRETIACEIDPYWKSCTESHAALLSLVQKQREALNRITESHPCRDKGDEECLTDHSLDCNWCDIAEPLVESSPTHLIQTT